MINVAIINQSKLARSDVLDAAGACQKHLVRDFAPIWKIAATVAVFEKAPAGYYPIYLKDQLDDPDAGGYHSDENGQPYSDVLADNDWTVSLSHELDEMLGDKFGNTFVAANIHGFGFGACKRMLWLKELCDPCEDITYTVNGIRISDFLTPHYWDPDPAASQGADPHQNLTFGMGVKYSFCGKIYRPCSILPGGYVSLKDPETNVWYQITWWDKAGPKIQNLGKMEDKLAEHRYNNRAMIDAATRKRKRLASENAEPV